MLLRGWNPDPEDFSLTLRRKVDLARAAMGLERLWPLVVMLAGVVAAFVALSWLGYFTFAPRWARIAVGVGFASAGVFALLMVARWRVPAAKDGARRLDLSDPALHRPVSALHDRAAGADPVAAALWKRHQDRARRAASALRVQPPRSLAPGLDRYALRALVLLILVAAGFVAGDERMSRLAGALAWGEVKTPPTPPRLDAWIDPPTYTGRAPIFLSGTAGGGGPVSAPVGSIAVVRVAPADAVSLAASGSIKPRAADAPAGPAAQPGEARAPETAAKVFEQRLIIAGDGTIEVKAAGGPAGRFDIKAIPDLPPKVDFTDIESEDRGQTLKLRYRLEDDYGIAKTEAIISRADGGRSRALLAPPEISLGGRLGENESALATQEHPWAGIRVSIKLRAFDDVGQAAESAAKEAVLPSRRFENAVSKALIEQRRNIVLEPDNRRRVQIALDGLMVAPDRFLAKSGDFLMISIALRKLRDARNDADLIALVQYLWDSAVAFDEGHLTDAERALRAAEDRLREAIERGATPDEIKRLMDELRQAMNEFLREFAERNRDNAERNDRNEPNRFLSQRDLNDMLRQIEEMYRRGDTAQAQELLRQLQEMMRNLRSAQRQQGDPRMREMGEALDELERMLREQEGLRDETFRDNQRRRERAQRQQRNQQGQPGQRGQRQQGQQGQQGEQGEDGDEGEEGQEGQQGDGRSLAERQQALRDRLNQLRERLRRQGAGDQEGFDGAEEGMGDAEQNLRRRQGGRATQGQQQAIDELGRAGRGLSQQMQQEMGDGQDQGDGQDGFGPGNPNPNDRRGRANSQNTDPLGRPLPNRGDQMDNSRVKIPQGGDIIGTGERARRVLEELRRRFGETVRPRDELDYIERLLPRN